MRILDLSHYQSKIDFSKVSDFCILKATESTNYLDPTFKERRDILRKKGLYLGCYHFFRDVDIKKQADWFASHADYRPGDILILDFEIDCPYPKEKCKEFLDQIGRGWIYTNENRNIKYGLKAEWIAKYGTNNGNMQTPPKGDWKLWQFSSKGTADGIEGNVDLNYTPLSLPELTGITPPTPPSEPTEPPTSGFTRYSQNNPLWKNDKMGSSSLTLGKYGCTSSVYCTQASWFGDTITPKELAKHKEAYTKDGLIIWQKLDAIFEHTKFLIRVRQFNEAMIDDALKDTNKACIVNVDFGYHWTAVLKKTYLGYTASDPWPFPSVNRNYKNKDISGFAILTRK
jgi:lysozyme